MFGIVLIIASAIALYFCAGWMRQNWLAGGLAIFFVGVPALCAMLAGILLALVSFAQASLPQLLLLLAVTLVGIYVILWALPSRPIGQDGNPVPRPPRPVTRWSKHGYELNIRRGDAADGF